MTIKPNDLDSDYKECISRFRLTSHAVMSIGIYNSETLLLGFRSFTCNQERLYAPTPQAMLCYLPIIVVFRISNGSRSVSTNREQPNSKL